MTGTYRAWCNAGRSYEDEPDFYRAGTLAERQTHPVVLTPDRDVGAEEVEDDGERFCERMEPLGTAPREQQAPGRRLDALVGQAHGGLGFHG